MPKYPVLRHGIKSTSMQVSIVQPDGVTPVDGIDEAICLVPVAEGVVFVPSVLRFHPGKITATFKAESEPHIVRRSVKRQGKQLAKSLQFHIEIQFQFIKVIR